MLGIDAESIGEDTKISEAYLAFIFIIMCL